MRIAWVVYGELAQPTGGYIYDRIVVEGLRAAGDDVRVVDPRTAFPSESRFDAIVGDGLCVPELGALFERAGDAARVLLVHHMPSWEIERPPGDREAMRRLEARAVAASQSAIVTGRLTAARLRAEAPSLRIAVVAPGADRLPLRPHVEGSELRLLSVGSLIARKRIELVLDALERAEEDGLVGGRSAEDGLVGGRSAEDGLVGGRSAADRVRLTLIGDAARDPAYAETIAARVRASPGLAGRVTFRGVVDDAELAEAMAAADALVLSSSLEGYGMVLAEALAAGLPVLASRPAVEAADLVQGVRVFEDAAGLARIVANLASDAGALAALRGEASAVASPRWADAVASFRAEVAARVSVGSA
jgi:glycosyltransferase involved in cell wall biosynthesis